MVEWEILLRRLKVRCQRGKKLPSEWDKVNISQYPYFSTVNCIIHSRNMNCEPWDLFQSYHIFILSTVVLKYLTKTGIDKPSSTVSFSRLDFYHLKWKIQSPLSSILAFSNWKWLQNWLCQIKYCNKAKCIFIMNVMWLIKDDLKGDLLYSFPAQCFILGLH